jgi:hypothetical protein
MPFRYLSSPTALALLNYSLPCIYLWIVYVILFPLYIHVLCCLYHCWENRSARMPSSLSWKYRSSCALCVRVLHFFTRYFLHFLCMFVLPACCYVFPTRSCVSFACYPPCRLASLAVPGHRFSHSRTPCSTWLLVVIDGLLQLLSLCISLACDGLASIAFQDHARLLPLNDLDPQKPWRCGVLLSVAILRTGLATRLLHLFLLGYFVFQVPCAGSILFIPLSYNQFLICFDLLLCRFKRGGTSFSLVPASRFKLSNLRRPIPLYVSPTSAMLFSLKYASYLCSI